jgi:hypothetical protein
MTARMFGPDQALMITHSGREGLGTEPVTIAAVQAAPVFCDRDATIEKVAELTKDG